MKKIFLFFVISILFTNIGLQASPKDKQPYSISSYEWVFEVNGDHFNSLVNNTQNSNWILVKVIESPNRLLKNKFVKLKLNDKLNPWALDEQLYREVLLTEKAKEYLESGHNIPEALVGKGKIHPIVSLAAFGHMHLGFNDFNQNKLTIFPQQSASCEQLTSHTNINPDCLDSIELIEMPIETSSPRRAVVKIKPNTPFSMNNYNWLVYDPKSKQYEESPVLVDFLVGENPHLELPQANLSALFNSDINEFDVFFFIRDNKWIVTAVVPLSEHDWDKEEVSPLSVDSFVLNHQEKAEHLWNFEGPIKKRMKINTDTIFNFKDYPNLEELVKNSSLRLIPRQIGKGWENYPMGHNEQFLVIHTYGANNIFRSKAPLKIAPGHFSFGFAERKPHPITQKDKIDITYIQIYGSNKHNIKSSRVDHATYAYHLQRGRKWDVPFSDTIISLNSLFGDKAFEAKDLLSKALDRAAAVFRIGDGTGLADIGLASSCVQDSILAFLDIASSIAASDDTSLEVKQLAQNFIDEMTKSTIKITFEKLIQEFKLNTPSQNIVYNNFLISIEQRKLAQERLINWFGEIVQKIGYLTPRMAEKRILFFLARNGYPVKQYLTVAPAITACFYPTAPTSLIFKLNPNRKEDLFKNSHSDYFLNILNFNLFENEQTLFLRLKNQCN